MCPEFTLLESIAVSQPNGPKSRIIGDRRIRVVASHQFASSPSPCRLLETPFQVVATAAIVEMSTTARAR